MQRQRLSTAKLVLFIIKGKKRKSGFRNSETSSYHVAELIDCCLAGAEFVISVIGMITETSWIGPVCLPVQLSFQVIYCGLPYIIFILPSDWQYGIIALSLAEKIFVLQIFVEMWLHHYSLEMYQKMQSPHVKVIVCTALVSITWWLSSYLGVNLFCAEFFLCVLVQRKEITSQSIYISVPELTIQLQRVLWISVSSRFAFIAEVVLVCSGFCFFFFVQDEFVGWSQQSEHQYQSTNDWENATIKPLC